MQYSPRPVPHPLRADLNLYPAREWKGRGWDWCDSMDPQWELDGFSDADIPDPERGAEGWVGGQAARFPCWTRSVALMGGWGPAGGDRGDGPG